jgi:hypothetical protein
MHPGLFQLIDRPSQWLMGIPLADRAMRFLSYQRKRVMRRKIEARLRAQGLYGDEVVRGPFKGLKFPRDMYLSGRFEFTIGASEHELFPLVERLAATKDYDEIINVGASEGVYGTGLGLLFQNAGIICYETLAEARERCLELAEINGVRDRFIVRGHCHAADLAAHQPKARPLVWMDIDTGEREVLDPVKVPWLREADIFVETHDCLEPGLSALIQSRFVKTHRIERFTLRGLDYEQYPELHGLNFEEIHAMVEHDRRGLHDWLFMEPLSRRD